MPGEREGSLCCRWLGVGGWVWVAGCEADGFSLETLPSPALVFAALLPPLCTSVRFVTAVCRLPLVHLCNVTLP